MLYTIAVRKEFEKENLSDGEKLSVFYHDLFDYPLNFSDLIKWKANDRSIFNNQQLAISNKSGYCFLEGKEGNIYKRALRKRISAKKLAIALNVTKLLRFVPGIKMAAVTGSLAMENATDESDIDLMIITKKGTLWTTRLLVYWFIGLFGIPFRRAGRQGERDKLCLNIWLDESDLIWNKKDRNIYSAHEIGQIRPLVNKDKTYENFLRANQWILKFWPNAVKISGDKDIKLKVIKKEYFISFLEKFAYWIQYRHMKSRITREVVSPSRALFHPQDWGKIILSRLGS